MPKAATSFRLADRTIGQLKTLAERWGMTVTETLAVLVDRVYEQEDARNDVAAAPRRQRGDPQ